MSHLITCIQVTLHHAILKYQNSVKKFSYYQMGSGHCMTLPTLLHCPSNLKMDKNKNISFTETHITDKKLNL